MIIREWRGRASAANADAYPAHFRANVLPDLVRLSGFLGAHLSKRQVDDKVEYLVLTRWRSMEAIHGFAHGDVAAAVVEPGAVAALLDFDARVRHYEVIEEVQST